MDIHVIPAIIPQDFNDLRSDLARLSREDVRDALGMPARVQIDIMDGVFAPTKSWPFVGDSGEFDEIIREEQGLPFWEQFDFEIDLMVQGPENYIDGWITAGVSSCIIHAASTDVHEDIQKKLKESHISFGIAFRPSDDINETLLNMADFVQIMGNDRIGYHGVELDERVYSIVHKIREAHPDMDIAVDIGVDAETSPDLIESGVNKLVSGSYIFDSMDMRDAIQNLRNIE